MPCFCSCGTRDIFPQLFLSSSRRYLDGCTGVSKKKVAIAVFRMFCFVVVGWVFRVRNVSARCKFRKASPGESDANHLRIIKIRHMMIAIRLLGKSVSFIKDLVKDVLLMEKLCELLNRNPGINKMPWWKKLGARLSINTDILDDLSPPQDHECPTEALIHYLGSWRPGLKIADFICALRKIDRLDAIDVLKGYLPGRRIINQRS